MTIVRRLDRILPLAALCLASVAAGQEYKTYDEAMREGARLLRDRQFTAAQKPLEAALALAADDAARMRVYQALLPAYRQLPEIEKMLEAQEFILRNAQQRAPRSLAGRDVASFLHQRGKLDEGIKRYEEQLKKEPEDVAALAILSAAYRLQRNNRGQELARRMDEVERKLARQIAERHERDAQAAPRLQAWHYKDAALAWLEAEDNGKALEAAKKSAASPPEERTTILAYYWRDALGDVFLKTGEPQLAASQFQAAIPNAPAQPQRESVEKKLAEAKAAAGE